MIAAMGDKMKPEIFVSVDVETNGPIPGRNSMIQLGAVALHPETLEVIGTFCESLVPLAGADEDPDTMRWWAQFPKVLADILAEGVDPQEAMLCFYHWLKALQRQYKARVVMFAYPAAFDFMWVYWYLIRFVGESPFGFSAVDIKTMAWMILGLDYKGTVKEAMPEEWFDASLPHTHNALDDAREQAALFRNIIREIRAGKDGESPGAPLEADQDPKENA